MTEILREYAKNAKHNKSDKNINIPAVIPIVLYNGKQVWDVPSEFKKMFHNEEKFHNGVLNFTYDIFDVNNGFTKEELLNQKNATAAIFLLDQKIKADEFLERVAQIALFFDSLSDEQLKQIKHWIKNTTEKELKKRAIDLLNAKKEEVENMVANNAFAITELKEENKRKGMAEGSEKGLEKGELKKAIEIARNLLDLLDDETIAKKTGLSINDVTELRENFENNK
ncbi:MAG: Rpn family recombination-promoting nuclease/putative transposase [Sarcina sp.]